jgi:NADH-ubiquinone oxidoreductase chain 1
VVLGFVIISFILAVVGFYALSMWGFKMKRVLGLLQRMLFRKQRIIVGEFCVVVFRLGFILLQKSGSVLIVLIFVLVGIAFFTLCERKLFGVFQMRKGPNKVGFIGVLQPFSDAGKLFIKQRISLKINNYYACFLAPYLLLFLSLVLWLTYPVLLSCFHLEYRVIFFLCVTSVNVYGVFIAGWGSNSKYALLGGMRAVAQTISYEITLVFILLCPLRLVGRFDIAFIYRGQGVIFNLFLCAESFIIWFIVILAETNRAPFDFVEGESELVSGFNVEYGGYIFAFIFMAEYINILFMSVLVVVLFIRVPQYLFPIFVVLVSYSFVLVRATFPRYRYDFLIQLT